MLPAAEGQPAASKLHCILFISKGGDPGDNLTGSIIQKRPANLICRPLLYAFSVLLLWRSLGEVNREPAFKALELLR